MRCRFCDADGEHSTFEIREMMFGDRESFVYFQCSECQCIQAREFLPDLTRYYSSDYFKNMSSHSDNVGESPVPAWCASMTGGPIVKYQELFRNPQQDWERILTERALDYYFSGINLRRDAGILDVGAASGDFLQSLRKVGFTGPLLGVEPHAETARELAGGAKMLKGTILDVDPATRWDLVTFHHSLEHMANPLESLRAAAALLADGGVCLIRVPVVPCYAWSHYGVNWISLDAPRHYFIPSEKTMRLLAAKAGLRVKKVLYDSTAFQFWASEQYRQDVPFYSERSLAINPDNAVVPVFRIPLFERKAEELNKIGQGDQAAFYLVRDEN